MDARCKAVLAQWPKNRGNTGDPKEAQAQVIAIDQAMMSLTLYVMAHSLLGADLRLAYGSIKEAVDQIRHFFEFVVTPLGFVPRKFPTPARGRFLRSAKVLDELIYRLIETALTSPDPPASLLTKLAFAWREADGDFARKLLRDDLLTIFLADHETTALTLTYALHLLSQNKALQERAGVEAATIEKVDATVFSNKTALPLIPRVIAETLRLYPPAWIFAREISGDDTVCGYPLPKGSIIVTSPSWIHRQPEYFPDPEKFLPDR